MLVNKHYPAMCECADRGCKVHLVFDRCTKEGKSVLYRIDMSDLTGTLFCDNCNLDALESGLFDTCQQGQFS